MRVVGGVVDGDFLDEYSKAGKIQRQSFFDFLFL